MTFIYGGEEERKGQHNQSLREAVGPGCVVCTDHSFHHISDSLRVVSIFPQGQQSERKVKIIPREKGETRWGEPRLAWDDFHARSRFARSTIPEEKWRLLVVYISDIFHKFDSSIHTSTAKRRSQKSPLQTVEPLL